MGRWHHQEEEARRAGQHASCSGPRFYGVSVQAQLAAPRCTRREALLGHGPALALGEHLDGPRDRDPRRNVLPVRQGNDGAYPDKMAIDISQSMQRQRVHEGWTSTPAEYQKTRRGTRAGRKVKEYQAAGYAINQDYKRTKY